MKPINITEVKLHALKAFKFISSNTHLGFIPDENLVEITTVKALDDKMFGNEAIETKYICC